LIARHLLGIEAKQSGEISKVMRRYGFGKGYLATTRARKIDLNQFIVF